jgi:hypothetical protein
VRLADKILIRSYLKDGKAIDLDTIELPVFKFFKSKYWNRPDVEKIIPENKRREQELIYERVYSKMESSETEEIYLNKIIPALEFIESSGLYTANGMEQSKYNPYTLTGRPSNTNNGINYAALNKDDGSRNRFLSRFDSGVLVEFDFDAYHLRLIANLIEYEFPEKSVHDHLGKMYFDTERLTKEEYEESKKISFRVLYGGVPKEFENIKYFKDVKNYIFELWDIYNRKGYIETPIYKRKFYKHNYEEMTPQKLFNYQIQAYETEKNIEVILSIQQLLKNKKTKMILYTYDSLLFDVSPADGKGIIGEIHNLMDMPTKAKYGKNYGDMKPLKL